MSKSNEANETIWSRRLTLGARWLLLKKTYLSCGKTIHELLCLSTHVPLQTGLPKEEMVKWTKNNLLAWSFCLQTPSHIMAIQ